MTLLENTEIENLEKYLKAERNENKKNEISCLYTEYKRFVNNIDMNTSILPRLRKYVSCKKIFKI
jgi:hypothetical protein